MSKKVICEIKGFEGTITLVDPLTYALAAEYEEAKAQVGVQPCSVAKAMIREVYTKPVKDRNFDDYLTHVLACTDDPAPGTCRKALTTNQAMVLLSPVLLKCIEEWGIGGSKEIPKFLPASPRSSAQLFATWLDTEVRKIYEGEELEKSDPKE